jgi:cysteine protease ATG4
MVPMDGAVRVSSIMQAATRSAGNLDGSTAMAWKPVLLLIPSRFGLDKLTERYVHNLKQLFRMPQFMGIAGGRPGRSLYFVASQGKKTVSTISLLYVKERKRKARGRRS